ncbi:MAG: pyridoxal phosphate-dependent aminotransferase [Legionellales bacterium]|jgi:aspartate aminotransferase|nr:pyridoxal phosphate-dependent aminotransferase [Legionellales bacterium]
MVKVLAKRVKAIKESATLTIAAKSAQLKTEGIDVIGLNVGEPDYDTPLNIKAAGIDAIHEGLTKYTAVSGTTALKESIVKKFLVDNNLNFKNNEVMVSCGAKQAIINLMLATLNPKDEVIIPAPYWTSYPDMCILAEAKPVIIRTNQAENFKITAEKLQKAITNKTKMIILNSPSNPSGMIYTKAELKSIASVLENNPNILILSDDIYEHIIWPDKTFYNILNVAPTLKDRTIIINGVSKSYAMTGWRIGYAAGPQEIISAMTKIQSQSTSSPCSISQFAAAEALCTDKIVVEEMVNTYHCRYKHIVKAIEEIPGVELEPSDGTFYILPKVAKLIKMLGLKNDLELTEFLLDKANVSVVPGSAFGSPQHIRISFAICKKRLQEAIDRIKTAIEAHTP